MALIPNLCFLRKHVSVTTRTEERSLGCGDPVQPRPCHPCGPHAALFVLAWCTLCPQRRTGRTELELPVGTLFLTCIWVLVITLHVE